MNVENASFAGLCGKLLVSFSAYTNMKKVFNTEQTPGTIEVINGLRVWSAVWVISVHSIYYGRFQCGKCGYAFELSYGVCLFSDVFCVIG